jgi:polysaccharide export outer membrane protein
VAIAAVLLSASCGDPPPATYPQHEAQLEDTRLGPGDVFEVRVFYGSNEMTTTYRVNTDGTISFRYLGTIEVAGKTPSEIEKLLDQRLADGYLHDPVVSVLVKEIQSRKVSVLGQVAAPGILPYVDGMTIVDAITKAGWFTPMAKKNAVTVSRTVAGKTTSYTIPVESIAKNSSPMFYVRPGDVVFVPERWL